MTRTMANECNKVCVGVGVVVGVGEYVGVCVCVYHKRQQSSL